MINTTPAVKDEIAGKHRIKAKVTIMLNDDPDNPTNLTIESNRLMAGGVTINDGTSRSGSFDIGAAIINQCTILLDNTDGAYSNYNFEGAVATIYAGVPTNTSGSSVTWLRKGTFILSDPTTTPAIITLKGVDYMAKFDRTYDGNLTFPKTLRLIIQHCCTQCGVSFNNVQFNNWNYSIQSNPFAGRTVTYRQVISYCAQIACCFARCDTQGNLGLKWYNLSAFNEGNEAQRHSVTKFSQGPSVNTEDVVITGVKVTASDAADGTDGESYLYGNEGYVLEIKDNPLILYGSAQTVATDIGSIVIGMRFRPGSASFLGDPTMEAGDAALITDRKGNQYRFYITNLTYSVGNFASFTCDAVPALRKSADRYSRLAATVAKLRQETVKQIDSYIAAQARLDTLAFNALGYFKTVEEQQDGSIIEYAHDAPTLADSTIIYKKSIDGFFVSQNGGRTYTNGFDSSGNGVLNILSVIGLDASWITTGTIGSQDGSVSIDFTNQRITLNGSATFFSNYLKASDVGANGSTTIDGGRITTGQIQDASGNVVFDLGTNGSLAIKKGSIKLGAVTSGGTTTYKFQVTDAGVVTITDGSIKLGTTTANSSTYSEITSGGVFKSYNNNRLLTIDGGVLQCKAGTNYGSYFGGLNLCATDNHESGYTWTVSVLNGKRKLWLTSDYEINLAIASSPNSGATDVAFANALNTILSVSQYGAKGDLHHTNGANETVYLPTNSSFSNWVKCRIVDGLVELSTT